MLRVPQRLSDRRANARTTRLPGAYRHKCRIQKEREFKKGTQFTEFIDRSNISVQKTVNPKGMKRNPESETQVTVRTNNKTLSNQTTVITRVYFAQIDSSEGLPWSLVLLVLVWSGDLERAVL